MSNLETYDQTFIAQFNIDSARLNETLEYRSIDEWDSVGHMALMAALEDAFDIMLDTEDIIDFSSYEVGKGILAKYDVDLNS